VKPSGSIGSHTLQGPQGHLIFEKDDGAPDPVTADQLGVLLREHAVPAVVLNACQSAMLDERADDPFASVAAALLRSGMRSVVAMAYSLFVSGAQQCLPAFYQRLFEEGSVAQAVRAGRQQMLAHRGRVCARGEFPLDDWLVPVLYQQDPLDFSFARQARAGFVAARRSSRGGPAGTQPVRLRRPRRRDPALERALRRPPAGS
jgi:CHAT domain-containing protein